MQRSAIGFKSKARADLVDLGKRSISIESLETQRKVHVQVNW